MEKIVIRGAREHNLKNIDLDLPRDQFVVITGLSGSGKSSLAFDTLYAEGQRRYVESLSAYARQFLQQMEKPDVDLLEGLSPAIAIEQKTTSKNPRSTVGTVTEIYDYLRVLFARVGHPHCPKCARPIASQTVQQIVDALCALPDQTRIQIAAPMVRGRKGEYRKELDELRRRGFARVRVDGEVRDLSEEITLDRQKKHAIEVIVDRVSLRGGIERRLADSIETAIRLDDLPSLKGEAGGVVEVEVLDGPESPRKILFSTRFACVECGTSLPEISPRLFSFNSPLGACSACDGLGTQGTFDPGRIVPDPTLTLRQGALAPWRDLENHAEFRAQTLESVARHYGFDLETPWKELPKKAREVLLYGSGEEVIHFKLDLKESRHAWKRSFEGVIPNLQRRWKETESEWMREELEEYMSQRVCPECAGTRLKPEALAVKLGGKSIADLTRLNLGRALEHLKGLPLTARETEIARRLLKEIQERLGFLKNVGLEYLTLDRAAASLAGGEAQRIRLATQVGSALVGVLYILDEPSIGLHPRDHRRLLDTLLMLRDLGNTVLVIEHDAETIRSADWVVDLGPAAGVHGGEVIAAGTPEDLMRNPKSLTGLFLSGKRSIPVPPARRAKGKGALRLVKAREHNLKNLTVEFPLGLFVCVTGVSGSGKSTLVLDTLYRAMARELHGAKDEPGAHDRIEGLEQVDKIIHVDQSPIGRTPRSNPATYTGLFAPIRDLFAQVPEARIRGYKPGRFSFNVKGGRCEACQGDGVVRIEMHFLPDVFVQCNVCKGERFNRETLEVHLKGKNIAEVLKMTVAEAVEFLGSVPSIREKLQTLYDVGLDYVELGQAATTLSGGEAQRVKLARELARRATGRTLYVLDEPTTGLHLADIEKLLQVLNRLVDQGNTVVVIEHHPDVVKTADWVIDLGPEGGDQGGEVVAAGPPESIAQVARSHTGRYLKDLLASPRPQPAAAATA